MQTIAIKKRLFSIRPLSPLGRTAVGALLGMTVLCGLMSFFSSTLFVTTVFVFLSAVLIVTGMRWAPLFGGLLSGYMLYIFLIQEAFPDYHLMHPKDALSSPIISFVIFVIILLILWCSVVAFGTSIGALIQNYRRRERQRPRWLTAALMGLTGVVIGAILIGAIAQPLASTSAAATTTNGVSTVHLGISSFQPSTVTVNKGSKLMLTDDGSFQHNLANGTWSNGQPQPGSESGAPVVSNLSINGKSVEIGPFNTAGVYHIYCTIHSGMELTITVQ
jgi:plastocyanin